MEYSTIVTLLTLMSLTLLVIFYTLRIERTIDKDIEAGKAWRKKMKVMDEESDRLYKQIIDQCDRIIAKQEGRTA